MSLQSFNKRRSSVAKEDFYTRHEITNKLCDDIIVPIIIEDSISSFIDFSAGDGYILSVLAQRCRNLDCKGVDKYPPKNKFCEVSKGDYLKTTQSVFGDLKNTRVMFGFNPPFGLNGQLAKSFLHHTANVFKPRWIVSIVPYCASRVVLNDMVQIINFELPVDAFFEPKTKSVFHHPSFFVVYASVDVTSALRGRWTNVFQNSNRKLPSFVKEVTHYKNNMTIEGTAILVRRIGNNCGKNGWIRKN